MLVVLPYSILLTRYAYSSFQSPKTDNQQDRAAIAAVSALKILGPRSIAVKLFFSSRRSSSELEKPPSGPIKNAVGTVLDAVLANFK